MEPGGEGINVARAIKKLGGEATAIFPSGGYTRKFFNHLLDNENVPSVILKPPTIQEKMSLSLMNLPIINIVLDCRALN